MDPARTIVASGQLGPFEGLLGDRVVHGHYRAHGDWSPGLRALTCERIRPRTVIDVGANIGLFSIPVARATGAHCICFEPEPDNLALLERNVARHGLSAQFTIHGVAADAAPGPRRMRLSPDNAGDHHLLAPDAPAPADGPEVAAAPLDARIADAELSPPTLLKLDTQGCELRALRGAARLLPQITHCLLEYWPAGLRRAGDSAAALRDALLPAFPFAAVLGEDTRTLDIRSTGEQMARLAFLGNDDPGFLDLLLLRTPTLA